MSQLLLNVLNYCIPFPVSHAGRICHLVPLYSWIFQRISTFRIFFDSVSRRAMEKLNSGRGLYSKMNFGIDLVCNGIYFLIHLTAKTWFANVLNFFVGQSGDLPHWHLFNPHNVDSSISSDRYFML